MIRWSKCFFVGFSYKNQGCTYTIKENQLNLRRLINTTVPSSSSLRNGLSIFILCGHGLLGEDSRGLFFNLPDEAKLRFRSGG